MYILQRKEENKWFDITGSKDLDFIINLKMAYITKYNHDPLIYRIIQVIV